MADDVRTRWHHWVEALEAGNVLLDNDNDSLSFGSRVPGFEQDRTAAIPRLFAEVPHYFLSESCIDLIRSSDLVERSIASLVKAGMAELKHEMAVVEFSIRSASGSPGTRYFVLVTRREWGATPEEEVYHPYRCEVLSLLEPDYTRGNFKEAYEKSRAGLAIPLWNGEKPRYFAVLPRTSALLAAGGDGVVTREGKSVAAGEYHFGFIPAPWLNRATRTPPVKVVTNFQNDCVAASTIAVTALLLLLRSRGVEQTSVSPARLNKSRVRRGARPIPDHTVVYLGHYYKRSGERVKYDPTKPGHKFQPFHIRGPHVQGYWVGPRGAAKLVEKWIEPYVVNYTEGAEPAEPKRKVVRVRRQREASP